MRLPDAQRRRLLDMAEAVARGGESPAADGPAAVSPHDDADEDERRDDEDDGRMHMGPPGRAVRWVRWMTAAAAAVFLFSVVQLFLARHDGRGTGDGPSGPGNTTPAVQRSTTAPNEENRAKRPAEADPDAQPETEGAVDR
jgi:hypothetical protein